MHPVLFHLGGIKIYSYGAMIALGVIAAIAYMTYQGRREAGLTFDQANSIFLYIFFAAVIGGKVFLIFENPSLYLHHPGRLFGSAGFVFYGSFLFAVPTMFWYFRSRHLPVYKMLDVMAVTTCIVHGFGRIGCFMAGCCYGTPTSSFLAVVFTDPASQAPLNVGLHPVQLYESGFLFLLGAGLFIFNRHKTFNGQLFLIYIMSYAVGRSILEMFRGDEDRGYVIGKVISNSQFIAILVIIAALVIYRSWSRKQRITPP